MREPTQQYCPKSGGQPGEDNTTHHLVPRTEGGKSVLKCKYCGSKVTLCLADVVLIAPDQPATEGVEIVSTSGSAGRLNGPDRLWCSLEPNHEGDHEAHEAHDLRNPALAVWRTVAMVRDTVTGELVRRDSLSPEAFYARGADGDGYRYQPA